MRKTVLLLHGLFDTGKVFAPLEAALQQHGFETLAPDLVPNDGSASIAELAERVAELVEHRIATQQPLAVVGFSMGGIVARYYLQELSGYQRVQQVVTIASPHNGSVLAYFAKGKGIEELRPRSALLQQLAASEDKLSTVQVLSLWTPLDLMVVPARSCVWRRAENLALAVPVHCGMLRAKAVHQTILNWLMK